MKSKLFALALIIAGSLAVQSASAQVHVNVGVYERDYPGYTYYSYPAWRGHYRDHVYYDHWHHRFEREHRVYFHGRSFDHDRYERENHWHGR
ncbi:MAG TPA: hypothetical protein VNW04_07720 [Puia sp.]|jgi:hypothetical protein|nr:hypothetical protein [Puia sp.]